MGKRTLVCSAAVTAVAVGSIAWAAIPTGAGVIAGCYEKMTGALRVIDSEAGANCRPSERALEWNQTGPQGPPGAAGTEVVGIRAIGSSQTPAGEVEVTARGTGPYGFPAAGEEPTTVLSYQLPAGKYKLSTQIGVRKGSGSGEVICYVRGSSPIVTAFLRVAVGTGPGDSRMTTVGSDGFVNTDTFGPRATLACLQDANATPTGADPVVFYATITATSVASFTVFRDGN